MELVKNEAQENTLQVFNCDLWQVRVIIENGEPLFCLADLAYSLDFRDGNNLKNTINAEFDKGGIFNMYPLQTKGGTQNFTFINESELYFVLMRSRSAKAKPFRQWLTKEVLPSIRKTDIGIKDSNKYLPQEINSNCIKADVKLFNFEMFDVETLFENSTPYFRLTDIENILGLTKGQSAKWIKEGWFDEDEVKLRNSQLGGHPLKYVAESGLYRILNRTNSPKARPFERWVTKEVLPSIRKTGSYQVKPLLDTSDPIAVLEALKDSVEKQIVLLKENKALKIENAEKQGRLDDYKAIERTRRSKGELSASINKNIRKIAQEKFNNDYKKAYRYVYDLFAKRHLINEKINMQYLKKNNDHLAEVLEITLSEMD